MAERLFWYCDWQHPSSAVDEITDDAEWVDVAKNIVSAENIFIWIRKFAEENDFSSETDWHQLRSLWTAFCLIGNYDPDTLQYDTKLKELWHLTGEEIPIFIWDEFGRSEGYDAFCQFDLWIGEYLC